MLPTCYFALLCESSTARSTIPLHNQSRFSRIRLLLSERPVAASSSQIRAASLASTPLRGSYPPPDQRVRLFPLHAGPPSPLARFPFAPRSLTSIARLPPCCQEGRLRITVPGSLPLEMLADSQTSWNLIHYAPVRFSRQSISVVLRTFSSRFICLVLR